jgi:hypothetical protein
MSRCAKNKGQSTLEFTFSMMVVFILLFGLGTIFIWSGKELSERPRQHEEAMSGLDMSLATGEEQVSVSFNYMRPIF